MVDYYVQQMNEFYNSKGKDIIIPEILITGSNSLDENEDSSKLCNN